MKLSTRIKKYVDPHTIYGKMKKCEDKTSREIVLMTDWGKGETYRTHSFDEADAIHKKLLSEGYHLLPLECPVVNSQNEIIMHYER